MVVMAAANEINTTDKGSTLTSNDVFSAENNGTAKFLGPITSGSQEFCGKSTISTSKRSLRAELSKSEMLNMVCFLEGELEAHETVIAALRNGIKHLPQTKPIRINDPHAALFRDRVILSGNLVSRQSSLSAIQADIQVRAVIEQQIDSLFQMVRKQRETNSRIVKLLEKRKHEHDTAQGLEIERSKHKQTKQELETEKIYRKKFEDDLKKLQDTLDFERDRVKKMVLFLMAERKQIITKYVEERKRSEDLAQILSEEKQRSDAIAEGLEEESKKSLRMEAELEKQTVSIENERKAMKLNLTKKDKRIKELEVEVVQLRNEIETLRKQSVPLRVQSSHNVPAPTLPAKIRSLSDEASAAAQSSVVNVAKIVQPTATVSSVPVSGPTTGIARSISPGQNQRQQEGISAPPAKVTPRKLSNSSSVGIVIVTQQQPQQQLQQQTSQLPLTSLASTIGTIEVAANSVLNINQQPLPGAAASQLSSSSSSSSSTTSGKVVPILSATQSSPLIMIQQQQTATILRGTSLSGGMGTVTSQLTNLISSSSSISVPAVVGAVAGSSNVTGSRGLPPPIPPNKPIIPPKREPSISRLGSIATNNINSNTTS